MELQLADDFVRKDGGDAAALMSTVLPFRRRMTIWKRSIFTQTLMSIPLNEFIDLYIYTVHLPYIFYSVACLYEHIWL